MTVALHNVLPPKTANVIALGALAYGIARTFQYILGSGSRPGITESPLKTLLPILPELERAQLPCPTDALSEARDVPSPYGSVRVYEWGPESGRKVLLVHGISTPSIALGAVAHGLAGKGCRVMLFDLYGAPLQSFDNAQHQGCLNTQLKLLTFVVGLAEDFLTTRTTYPKTLVSFVPRSLSAWHHHLFRGQGVPLEDLH